MRGIIGWKPPWQLGELDINRGPQHIFFADLKGRNLDFSRLEGAWLAISNTRLSEYRAALPTEWSADEGVTDEVLDYIMQVRNNIVPALAEVVRILS